MVAQLPIQGRLSHTHKYPCESAKTRPKKRVFYHYFLITSVFVDNDKIEVSVWMATNLISL
ncbi:hypothetical protein XSR1_10122 [Xenorhabdus szentirmaii DSM 16338]|uniref:Uncharacterized protein n=1 Tax=Xenorhabdus szentirmaii DSM 16338 TaxID=1427518 RepID=W1IQ72_9GAMM|nr:hypothetical protein XSR1_10122 [Xenorhabdus szentirmaii DSM 16338]